MAIVGVPVRVLMGRVLAARGAKSVAFWTLAGLALRIAAARGDLWLDEIWSYRLVARITSLSDVFFALPYDNNHMLNSAWLVLVGPNVPSIIVRLPSILFGTLCIPVTAKLVGRRRADLAPLTAALVALSGPFVQFASEARGYAGLMLAAMVALVSLEAVLERPSRKAPLRLFCFAIAFGTLSHLTMTIVSLTLGVTAIVRIHMRGAAGTAAWRQALSIALAIGLGTLPAFICWSVSVQHGLHIGGIDPFSWSSFVLGLGRMAQGTFGLPYVDSFAPVAMAVAAAFGIAGIVVVEAPRRVFPALAIFGVPALQALLRLPNEEYARFHLLTGLGLTILLIDVAVEAERRSDRTRLVIRGLVALVLVGQVANLVGSLDDGRGAYRAAVKAIGAEGPATVAVEQTWIVNETRAVLAWYAKQDGIGIEVQPHLCPGTATWLLRVSQPGDRAKADSQIPSPAGCATRYSLRATFPAYGLSGFTWRLYRRDVPNS